MIVKPTVFVLGAGASRPYGFPVGSKLAEKVCALMPTKQGSNTDGLNWIQTWLSVGDDEFSSSLAKNLPERFKESGCETLDEFVEAPGNHRFLPLVKAGIIKVLLECENDVNLFPQPPKDQSPKWSIRGSANSYQAYEMPEHTDDDWVRYLLRIMRTDRPETFSQNQVNFVTFNFDRSFERRLYTMLLASYGVPASEAAALASSIPVLHMHGRLGAEGWIHITGREYGTKTSGDEINSIYRDIRIVHEEIEEAKIDLCHQWLDGADTIVFLGFGYHQSNIRRLGMDRDRIHKTNILGTAYGLTEAEAMRARRRFAEGWQPEMYCGKSCLGLLRDVEHALRTH
jgi:hypothetical protein